MMRVKLNLGNAIIVMALLLFCFSGPASTIDGFLSLPDLIEQSLRENPGVTASASSVGAAQARVPQAGALPDPQLRVGAMSLPVNTFELDQEPMTQITVGVAQAFPYPGKLGARTEISDYALQAEKYRDLAVQQEITYQVRAAYYDLVFLDRAIEVTSRNRDLTRGLARIAEARYVTGAGIQQDVLKAQVELSRMIDELIAHEQGRAWTAVELNRLIDAEPGSEVALTRPVKERPALPDRDQLITMARTHNPMLLASQSMVDKAESASDLARLSNLPDFTIMMSYGFREDGEINGREDERPDFLSGSVSVPVPLWKKRKQDQQVAEKDLQKRAAQFSANDLESRLVAQVDQLLADSKRLEGQILLLETGIIPQARQSLESARAGYQTGKVDFLFLLDNLITLFKQELRLIRLQSDYLKTLAALDLISGKPIDKIVKDISR